MTMREGPALELLLRRLAETPEWFLREPRMEKGKVGDVELVAVLRDLLQELGSGNPDEIALRLMQGFDGNADRGRTALVLAWLIHDAYFLEKPGEFAVAAERLFRQVPARFDGVVKAERFVAEPDRREELARLSLKLLELRPSGETEEQADDRLVSLDSVERARVMRETWLAEKHARELRLREEMALQRAREAAASYARE